MTTKTLPKITMSARRSRLPVPASWGDSSRWEVTLRVDGRSLRLSYYMGSALRHEPETDDVLNCLCMDAAGYLNARNVDDWCREYGMDPDSHKDRLAYVRAERATKRLEVFLGDEFESLVWAGEDAVKARCAS